MRSLLIASAGALLTLTLTILACFATYRRSTLSLPTPPLAHALAIATPGLTAVAAYRYTNVAKTPPRLRIPSPLALLSILDGILLTLAASDLHPQALSCFLFNTWTRLFQAKDERTIRHIQDTLECCGFKTVNDRAWPFNNNGPSSCAVSFKRNKGCEGPLAREEKVVLGLLVAIASCGFLAKALVWVLAQQRPAWFPQQHAANGHTSQNRITEGEQRIQSVDGGRYLDEPGHEAALPVETNWNRVSDDDFRE